jgi:hypothetical protein
MALPLFDATDPAFHENHIPFTTVTGTWPPSNRAYLYSLAGPRRGMSSATGKPRSCSKIRAWCGEL